MDKKQRKYKLIMKAQAGNTTGQIEDQQQHMTEWLKEIGYKGGMKLPERK